jgi:TonB family protein
MAALAMMGITCLSPSVATQESFGEQRVATGLLRPRLNFPPGTENPKDATDLVPRALKQENLFATESPSLNFHARIDVAFKGSKVATGDYTKLWVSPAQWREEISLANFHRIRVGQANGYWQKRDLDYQPEAIFQIDRLLNLKSVLELSANETVGKASTQNEGGTVLTCMEVNRGEKPVRKLCFDQAQGVLVSVTYLTLPHSLAPEFDRVEYSEFAPWKEKLFPNHIRALSGRRVVADVTALKLADLTSVDAPSFDPLKNADFWPRCGDDLQKAKPVSHVSPEYPHAARVNHVQGRVIFFAVVELDGSLSRITVIHPAAGELENAALQAVRQWRYTPASCAGAPVRFETSISVEFWLDLK